MDNLTHTLVGAALAESGLKHRTRLGAATLMIGANFPDVDILAVPLGVGIEFRRGVTHGFLALVVLPFVLAGIMLAWDRRVRRRRDAPLPPADYRQLALLSAIAIATHPTLDFMNTYGMRWLMPFVDRWYYADGLFIVDPWMMLALIAGVMVSRRMGNGRPARLSLAVVAAYVVAMLGVTTLGRAQVGATVGATRFMVAPAPLVPWRRDVVVEEPGGYRLGRYTVPGRVELADGTIARGDHDPAVAAARATPQAQRFLHWARLPFYRVIREDSGTVVRIADARYTGDDARGWAAIEVRLPGLPRLPRRPRLP